jgi:glycosyltransferase involved in cell wall biosynthesis
LELQGIISACHIHFTGGISPKEIRPFEFTPRRLIWGTTLYGDQTYWREVRQRQEAMSMRKHRYFAGRTGWDCAWVRLANPAAECFHLDETLRPAFWLRRRDLRSVRRHSIYCSAAVSYPLKGGHFLLRAVASLRRRYPRVQLRIALGAPRLQPSRSIMDRLRDDGYAGYLRRLIRDLGLADHVVLLPALTAEQVAEELTAAHIFCLPSLCENSPNSLGEAMLVGTPAVATYVGGIPSVLRNQEDGILCPPADVAALVEAISSLFDDDKLAERYAGNARATALARHDAERNARATLDVYRTIIRQASKARA